MSMFNDISCRSRDNEKECLANVKLVSLHAWRLGKGQWSFVGLGSEKKWYCISEDNPQGIWDKIAERLLLEFAESGCLFFSRERTVRPVVIGQQSSSSLVLSAIKTEVPLDSDDPAFKKKSIATIWRTN